MQNTLSRPPPDVNHLISNLIGSLQTRKVQAAGANLSVESQPLHNTVNQHVSNLKLQVQSSAVNPSTAPHSQINLGDHQHMSNSTSSSNSQQVQLNQSLPAKMSVEHQSANYPNNQNMHSQAWQGWQYTHGSTQTAPRPYQTLKKGYGPVQTSYNPAPEVQNTYGSVPTSSRPSQSILKGYGSVQTASRNSPTLQNAHGSVQAASRNSPTLQIAHGSVQTSSTPRPED